MPEVEEAYPVRTLHNFVTDLNGEWRKFRIVSVLSVSASLILLWFLARFTLRMIEGVKKIGPVGLTLDLVFLSFSSVALGYSLYAIYSQNRFFSKWGKRLTRLEEIEASILEKEKH